MNGIDQMAILPPILDLLEYLVFAESTTLSMYMMFHRVGHLPQVSSLHFLKFLFFSVLSFFLGHHFSYEKY